LTPSPRSETSETLQGIGVSAGIAIGRALVLEGSRPAIHRLTLSPVGVAAEVGRFRAAVRESWRQLRRLRDRVRSEAGEGLARVFQAQILILKDRALLKETVGLVRRERVNSEWAYHSVVERYTQVFAGLGDPALRERGSDIEDVEARVIGILSGRRRLHDLAPLPADAIVVSAALGPSDAAALSRGGVIGLAIDGGGPTSHTAIVASALGVPAVVGLGDASARLRTGDPVALDGARGLVIRGPTEAERADWEERRGRWLRRERDLAELREQPATTRDGVRVRLLANIEFPQEVAAARRQGAEGIGLYRSEFLYLREGSGAPDEGEHYAAYRAIAEAALPHEVVIRTLDFGADKPRPGLEGTGGGRATLGLRGIRLGLRRPDLLKTQIRGILRAAAHGRIRILLPMVSGVEEVRHARSILDTAREELRREGIPFAPETPLGVMIEVPAAALIADSLAAVADFFALGTNDLIQYTLAADRGAESVSYLYEPLHPAIVELVRRTVEAAARRGVRVSVCGEMAGDPVCAVALLGLGVTELSMKPSALPAVKQVIRAVTAREARIAVEEASRRETAAEVAETLRRSLLSVLPAEFACPI
jgi:phosphotransferase system enzyme I (PtsI)